MNKQTSASHAFYYPVLLVSCMLLLIPAFWNHFPLVNPDTATYIASGFKPETPFDRPITYGLLIRLFSLNGVSLWLVVFVQALIVSWLLLRIVRRVSGDSPYLTKGVVIVLFLSVGTGLSWEVSQVQPDVFTSVAFLCVALILLGKERRLTRVLLYVLYFLAVAVHLSHPLLMAGSLILLFICRRAFRQTGNAPIGKPVIILCVLAAASILIMGSAMSKSKHVFFMASLLEKGVLKKYLDDNCGTHAYKLCAYKDSLPPVANDFIWNDNSPLYKVGSWQGSKPEFNEIIRHILTEPKYLGLFIEAVVEQTGRQAITFNAGEGNQQFLPGSGVYEYVSRCFPRDTGQFLSARENKEDVPAEFELPNKVFAVVVMVSLLVLLYAMARWKSLQPEMRLILFVLVTGVVANCVDCATFGLVYGRYGCKMIWLVPFCAGVLMQRKIWTQGNVQM